jgi:hypothetical protein
MVAVPSALDTAKDRRCKKIGESEPNCHRLSDHADAAGRKPIWDTALDRWNVNESSLATELIAEGEAKAYANVILEELTPKVGCIPKCSLRRSVYKRSMYSGGVSRTRANAATWRTSDSAQSFNRFRTAGLRVVLFHA